MKVINTKAINILQTIAITLSVSHINPIVQIRTNKKAKILKLIRLRSQNTKKPIITENKYKRYLTSKNKKFIDL
jgi:hypothetical protein